MTVIGNQCLFGVSDQDPGNSDYYDGIFTDLLQTKSPRHFFFELDGSIEDSDIIGVGVSPKDRMIMFTQNGEAIAAFQHDLVPSDMYLPCVRNVGRIADLNIGQRGDFAFVPANEFRNQIADYLRL